jgi:methylamine dehydrogenase accessory protein MauD
LLQNGRLWARIEELEARLPAANPGTGQLAPDFDLPDLHGFEHGLDDLLACGEPALVIFTDPRCGACDPLLPEVGRLQRDESVPRRVVVISRGDVDENRAKASEHGLVQVMLQADFEVARAFGAVGLPAAVRLDRAGRSERGPALGAAAVAEALAEVRGSFDGRLMVEEWTP